MVLSATCQSKDQVTDLTDPKMSQCLTELTGYKNIDELMSKVYQEFLTANNLTSTAKGTLSSLIGYQNTLQATDTSKLRIRCYCYRRVKFLFWWVCVSWRCTISF
jgi:hypothetical protein